MQTLEAIYQRRAVKHYDPEHKMTDAEEQQLLEATIKSPTSYNIQHWRFVILRDDEVRAKVQAAAYDQAQITESSLTVLFCADTQAWQKQPDRYWRDAPEPISEMLLGMLTSFYQDRDWLQRDEAIRSIGMAMQTMMLTAKSMGYDSCPMIGFDFDKVAKVIQLPDDHVIGGMITIGKALKPANGRGGQLPLSELVFDNKFA